jgi:hypothetical protein
MRHGSPSRVGSGQRVVANGESGRGTPDHDAPATIGKRTRKGEEAWETGHGSSEGESSGGQLQGRERHETRPRSVGCLGKRWASQGVRARRDDRPEPSRGARTLRTAPTGVWQPPSARLARASLDDKGAPDVVAFVGAITSREADPTPESHLVRSRGSGRRTVWAGKLWQNSQRRAEPQERISRELVFAGRARRGKPRGRSERRGGSARSQQGATRRAEETSVEDGDSRERLGARATASRAPR